MTGFSRPTEAMLAPAYRHLNVPELVARPSVPVGNPENRLFRRVVHGYDTRDPWGKVWKLHLISGQFS